MKKVDFPTIGDLKQVLGFRTNCIEISYNQETCSFHVRGISYYLDHYDGEEFVNEEPFEEDIPFFDAYKEWESFTEAMKDLPF